MATKKVIAAAPLVDRVRSAIVDVPDHPKPGIVFKDLTPVYEDPALFRDIVAAAGQFARGRQVQAIAAIEMRGMITGTAMAHLLGIPLILLRKKGRLPRETYREEYQLEYGTDALEMHRSAPVGDRRVLIVDDLLATGGTAAAAARLVAAGGGKAAGYFFIVELAFLKGRDRLGSIPVESLVRYA